ncbi:uncharacterized protein LOC123510360 isoform X2 [Portunus trituberculatus]|uniref:uncharacterized protein LOC123510360 isoform X2 n=1 Tax=Portunus trituberculatus TaxID=210409 RepID=UPI001E1CC185|nr:uncharacterized protein LOC123510360 isoform X2 [Portunus trituberculatus]
MSLDLIADITRDEEATYAFLKQQNCILRTAPKCCICGRELTLVKCGRRIGAVWRCPSHKGNCISIRSGSFWEKSRLPLSKLVQLAFCWAYDHSNKTCEDLTGVNKNTVGQWYQYFRDVCSHHLIQNPIMIGGENLIIELDESVVTRRRDRTGHGTPERLVFGGFCPSTQEGFLVFVPNKEAATLLPIIQQYVRPGSIIHTDGLASYDGIGEIDVQPPYIHHRVDHSGDFVDPNTGASTNHVEEYWRRAEQKFRAEKYWGKAKQKFKAMYGSQGNLLDPHLNEFHWRERMVQCHCVMQRVCCCCLVSCAEGKLVMGQQSTSPALSALVWCGVTSQTRS